MMLLTHDWRLWSRVQILAAIAPDLTKWLPLERILSLATPKRPQPWCEQMSVEELLGAVERRLRKPRRMRGRRCLRRSLIAYHLLRLSGRRAVLHFGIFDSRRSRTKGHCWVSLDGQIITEPAEEPCTEVLRYDPAA